MLFCCPVCQMPLALSPDGRVLSCQNRHCFDRAAEGYFHLLPSNKMHAKIPGDNKEMVAARREFLRAGYYQIFSDGINCAAAQLLQNTTAPNILDAGCGEGYYTIRLRQSLCDRGFHPAVTGFDISKFAVKAAAKADKQAVYAVASSFDIPVLAQSCDFLLNVFSPIVSAEFCRVLKRGGYLLIAVPSPRHLFGLKELLYQKPYENAKIDTVYDGFDFIERIPIRDVITLNDPQQIQNLFSMTPYYWKTPAAGAERLRQQAVLTTEIGFDLLVYQKI